MAMRRFGTVVLVLAFANVSQAFLSPPALVKSHSRISFPSSRFLPRTKVLVPAMVQANERATSVSPEGAVEREQFVWTKNWYPVAATGDLDAAIPNERWILGRKIILWKDESAAGKEQGGSDGCWRAVDDACPHRLTSLALGRVNREDGSIMCRYHGWEFDGKGTCVKCVGGQTSSSVNKNALSYPSQTAQGMVWVWPDNAATRFVDAHVVDLPVEAPEVQRADGKYMVSQFDFASDWEIFTENTFDPIHAMATHEGTLPSYLPENAVDTFNLHTLDVPVPDGITQQSLTARAAEPHRGGMALSREGFVLAHRNYDVNEELNCTRVFAAPSTTVTRYARPGGGGAVAVLHKVPTRPGIIALFSHFGVVVPEGSRSASRSQGFRTAPKFRLGQAVAMMAMKLLPPHIRTAMAHLRTRQSLLMQQDDAVMHDIQHRAAFARDAGMKWSESFALVEADAGAIAFRKWLDKYGGGAVKYLPQLGIRKSSAASDEGEATRPPEMEAVKHSHWEMHVKHCAQCRKGLAALSKLDAQLRFAPAALLALAVLAAALRSVAGTAVLSLLLLAATVLQSKVRELVQMLSGERAATGPTTLRGRLPTEAHWPAR